MKKIARWMFTFVLALLTVGIVKAQKPPAAAEAGSEKAAEKPQEKAKEEKKTPAPPEEKSVTSKHTVRIGGQEIHYTATAGTILLKLEDGTPKASVFYVAYTRDDASDLAKRPVTYAFNGGPGRRPYGCTWGRWDRGELKWATWARCFLRRTRWWTTNTRCWT